MLQSGFDIEDTTNFCKRIHGMVRVGLGADDDATNDDQELPKLDECDNNDDVDQVDWVKMVLFLKYCCYIIIVYKILNY